MKKIIKINFTDFWNGFDKKDNFFYRLLSTEYEVEIADEPEYLFYSSFGREYLKYDCIRIFFAGENVRPDFNLCDYAIGFDRMSFGDRYLRYPLYMLYDEDWEKVLHKHEITEEELQRKEKFCNFIYSNANTTTDRDQFFKQLSAYKHVESGGRYLNNVGRPVADKVGWQSNYRFTIAFENSVTPGYVTEKLIHAYAAKTIPIYLGDPDVLEDFHEGSMIFCNGDEPFSEIIEKIRLVEENPAIYEKMLRTPALKDEVQYRRQYNEKKVLCFLQHIINQPKAQASRRSRYKWTTDIENEQKFLRILEKSRVLRYLIRKSN